MSTIPPLGPIFYRPHSLYHKIRGESISVNSFKYRNGARLLSPRAEMPVLELANNGSKVVAATETKREVVVCHHLLSATALPATTSLDLLIPSHWFPTMACEPIGLHAKESRTGFTSFLADVFPLGPVIQAHAVNTLPMGALLVAIVHSNSPFWPPFS